MEFGDRRVGFSIYLDHPARIGRVNCGDASGQADNVLVTVLIRPADVDGDIFEVWDGPAASHTDCHQHGGTITGRETKIGYCPGSCVGDIAYRNAGTRRVSSETCVGPRSR